MRISLKLLNKNIKLLNNILNKKDIIKNELLKKIIEIKKIKFNHIIFKILKKTKKEII